MAILDSGERKVFDTGAVRDMKEGKGRCDLMPLDVVGQLLNSKIIDLLYMFQQDQSNIDILYNILEIFADYEYRPQGPSTSITRKANMLLEVSKHFEEGAKKYEENNWKRGIEIKSYIDSACRHYLKVLRGDKDESHERAFVWNTMCLIWTVNHIDGNKDEQETKINR